MSFGFLGIQFGFALQNANVSRIFQTLGAESEEIPILWLAAPVTGLLVQPIIGYFSDRTWHPRLGRRRPFFLAGAILAAVGLFIMPNSPALWVAAGMLWILDGSVNVSMEPFRALVGDMLPGSQRTAGFAAQTFFIGVGAVVASLLPYIMTNYLNISNTAPDGQIPDSVRYSFYIGGVVFLGAVLVTVFGTKEYNPQEFAKYNPEEETDGHQGSGMIAEIIAGLRNMPKTMQQLAVVQFFSWLALFCMWIYTTDAVTSHIYGTSDTQSPAYNDGADWVGVLFAFYNGVAAIAALLLPLLAKATSRKTVHAICLAIGGVGLLSIFFINDPNLLIVSMVCIGVAWASILAMPYAMLAGSLPASKMGFYMGIFNFFIVIPQVFASLAMGSIVGSVFGGQAIYALVTGGVCMLLAAVLVRFVNDVDVPEGSEQPAVMAGH